MNQLTESANDLSVDDVNQKLKHNLVRPYIEDFFPPLSKLWEKKNSNSTMTEYEEYNQQCYDSCFECHRAKGKSNKHKRTVT